MHILLNGEAREVADDTTLADPGYASTCRTGASPVEINELVPRSEHATHRLQPDDRIEIVQAIGGG